MQKLVTSPLNRVNKSAESNSNFSTQNYLSNEVMLNPKDHLDVERSLLNQF